MGYTNNTRRMLKKNLKCNGLPKPHHVGETRKVLNALPKITISGVPDLIPDKRHSQVAGELWKDLKGLPIELGDDFVLDTVQEQPAQSPEPSEPRRPSMTGCQPPRPSMTGCEPTEPRLRGKKKKKVTWGENETRIIPARPEESQSRPSMTGCDVPSVQDNQVLAVEKPLRRRNVKKPKAPAQQPKVTLRDELAAKLKSRNVDKTK